MTTDSQSPIFILGMLQRTGTNHLWDLFALHPDVEALQPVFEDHLVRWSPHLAAYVEDVSRCWSPEWEVPSDEAPALLRSIGSGITSWVAAHSEKRIVTKMPSVEQANRFFDLFTDTPVVLLVRDGRNVCESGVKSFGWSYERAFRRWSQAADIVLKMTEDHRDDPMLAMVRYEDLVADPKAEMERLCRATGLDVDRYPFAAIDQLPVRGSSTLRSESGESEVHWAPVERTSNFDPTARWASWDEHTRRRFMAVAGRQQQALGYDGFAVDGGDSVGDRLNDLKDLTDVRLRELRVKIGRARRAVGRVHGRV